ncbi:MAG: hypothetical protein A3J83_07445 [Elusimicrobia bacterium RIFOXYA2_FULL_40_6]|nr:MAG: hypothetical protein A3J83_07445 [Elusimicrobia bacterium RIFOXYA2_FULL_40_6]
MTKKILIAENEWELRNLLKLILEKYDFDVMEAEDDKQAVNLVSSFKPDLLMLDLSMKGFEIVHRLRNNYGTQSLPVVMLIDKIAIKDSPIKEYVQDFLLKPFEEDSIVLVLKKIFGDVQKKAAVSKRPFGSVFSSDSEKTVVLSPNDLPKPSFRADAEAEKTMVMSPSELTVDPSPEEKTMVLSPEEIMAITKQAVKPVIPETFSPESTIQVNPIPEEQIPTPAPEIPGASVPEFMPESTIPGSSFEKLFGKPEGKTEGKPEDKSEKELTPFSIPAEEDDIPVIKFDAIPFKKEEPEPIPVPDPVIEPVQEIQAVVETKTEAVPETQTKFYNISNTSIKDLLMTIYCSEKPAHIDKNRANSILVIANGSSVDSNDLGTIMDIFGPLMNIVTIDAAKFNEKMQDLASSGIIIFEIDPSGFKKI